MRRSHPDGKERSPLPPLYAAWMREWLPGPIPRESDATCEECAMWPGSGGPSGSAGFFLPDTKCCTYVPTLPNYLVGRILEDDDPALAAGRATIEKRIDARIGVTPIGLASPPVKSLLYRQGGGLAFGRSRRLRCPHYQAETGGRCGIWRHRNGTCATWFCKHVRGAVGLRFWQGLDQLLTIAERALARWCLLEMGVATGVLHRLFPPGTDRLHADGLDGEQIDGVVSEEIYRELWGSWAGREREFYRRAARLVDRLNWSNVLEVGGTDVRLFAALALDRYRELASRRLPKRLIVGPIRILAAGRDRTRVVGYNGLHPLDLSPELMAVLPYFDGRSVRQVLQQIRKEKHLTLEMALLQRLADFEILRPVD